ncbi:DNA gyrase subunit A [Candidatus Marinimicrobia bacterium MT.SAG.2]|nr:DNA gyrase subunit A [Candidatus Marinimicrobia bacterium MT.SAG.2]
MAVNRDKILPVEIVDEMRNSYLDYSMSVIVSRALPDARDGLKPVHRRILYGMDELGLRANKSFKKCARIVGEVLGKFHPHGDTAIYDSLVRMAQDFSLRYPLVKGQGNFGSVDGDGAAAMRYTEAKMHKIAEEMLQDIDKDTVKFIPNFDDTLEEPTVLPTRLPQLHMNGTSGIAVGMATNIPPHNLREISNAIIAIIDNPDIEIEELLKFVSGPDFPTGGIIYGKKGIRDAFLTGRGSIKVRSRVSVEVSKNGRESIIISEIPFQVNKSNLIIKTADLVRDKVIEGIRDIRDESDRDGIRVVMDLKRDVIPDVVINQLFKHTQLQDTFSVNFIALVNGEPKLLNLKESLLPFIGFRHEVVLRRTKFEKNKAENRAHILEGLKIALDNIDEIIKIIKKSESPELARTKLMKSFDLSERQAKAILEMRLSALTGLEQKKIVDELSALLKLIEKLTSILSNKELRMEIVKEELIEITEKYGDDRRTDIVEDEGEFSIEDMIAQEDMVITISHNGFIKRFPVSGFKRQGRGGRGLKGASTKEDDYVEHLFVASTHHHLLIFTDRGKCHWLKVHEVPQAGRASRGRAIINILQLEKDENPQAFLAVSEFDDDHYILMATERGLVKKTVLSAYKRPMKGGIYAIDIREGDKLIEARLTDGSNDVILGSLYGKAIRFNESDARPMGRKTRGVRGMRLQDDVDRVIGMIVIKRSGTVLAVSENGFGKRTGIDAYPLRKRGGKGVLTIRTTEKVGKMLSIKEVVDTDDLMIITQRGIMIRQSVSKIRSIGRATQGVKLIRLDENDSIASVTRVMEKVGNNEDENSEEAPDAELEE